LIHKDDFISQSFFFKNSLEKINPIGKKLFMPLSASLDSCCYLHHLQWRRSFSEKWWNWLCFGRYLFIWWKLLLPALQFLLLSFNRLTWTTFKHLGVSICRLQATSILRWIIISNITSFETLKCLFGTLKPSRVVVITRRRIILRRVLFSSITPWRRQKW